MVRGKGTFTESAYWTWLALITKQKNEEKRNIITIEKDKKKTQQHNISTQVLKFQKETNVLEARGLTVV